MKNIKNLSALALSIALMLSCVFIPDFLVTETVVNAEGTVEAAQTGALGLIGETTGSKTGLSYKSIFTEDWEGGLDLDKWYVDKYDSSYISDFQVVDDPLGGTNEDGSADKVLTFTRLSTWLVPSNDYWPTNGVLSGDLKEVTFKVYFKDADSLIIAKKTQLDRDAETGIMCAYTDPKNYDGWAFATGVDDGRNGFVGYRDSRIAGVRSSSGVSLWAANSGYLTEGFDFSGWIDVKISFSGSSYTFEVTDKNGLTNTRSEKRVTTGGKFAIGNRLFENITNKQQTNGVMYIDDINVSFSRSVSDTNDVQKDVTVYYAGNTFLNPGDTINITGEQLGKTVASAKIKKIDTAVSSDIADIKYVNENTYEYTNAANVNWEDIPYIEGSLIEDFKIEQRTEIGLKMVLPDGSAGGQEMYAEKGSYAVLLEAAAEDGKDAVVIINNPQISLLMGDDGDYATSDGWLKLGGYNLSVQDSQSKVSAVITNADGTNPRFVDNSNITIDTTENNGESNDYYMMINLDNLAVGNYKISVHNGYGGNYGWSMPFDFEVKEKAENEIWAAKGLFDVTDYGAVGDSSTNDTAAIFRAIDAAVQNGGGTVYFPARDDGTVAGYRITSPLIVGENISFVGDGDGRTVLFYSGFLDTENREYLISFEKNFEIRDMQVSCLTNPFAELIHRSTENGMEKGKVYIKNVKMLNDFTAACSGGIGALMEGYNLNTASSYIFSILRARNHAFYTPSMGDTYFSITGSEVRITPRVSATTLHISVAADYLHFEDFYANNNNAEWSIISANEAGFYEGGATKSLGPCMLYRNSGNNRASTNNRELFLRDQGGESCNNHIQPLIDGNYTDETLEIILDDELENLTSQSAKTELINSVKAYVNNPDYKGKVYRFLDYSKSGYAIYVTQGQGTGQMRRTYNFKKIGNYMYFTVETPFTITPNRSSEVNLSGNTARKCFVNNCTFEDGSMVGPYGVGCDIVFDKTTMRKAQSGISFTVAYTKGFMWYCSAIRTDCQEIGYLHTNRVDYDSAGLNGSDRMSTAYANIALRYSDSYTADVTKTEALRLVSLGTARAITSSDAIFENNVFIGDTPAIAVELNSNTVGVWLKNNKQYTEADNPDSEICAYNTGTRYSIKTNTATCNGTLTLICDEKDALVSTRLRGDVNNDSKITIKDMTIIRYLLVEKLTASEIDTSYGKQTSTVYADANNDGVVDIRDVYAIRNYILTGEIGDVGTTVTPSEPSEPDNPSGPSEPSEPSDSTYNDDAVLDYSNTPEVVGPETGEPEIDYGDAPIED